MAGADFPQSDFDWLCNEVLSLIEINEARLLDWGFVDVRTNLVDELPHLISRLSPEAGLVWQKAQEAGFQTRDIQENLDQRKLIFPIQGYYRSRFAEAVRLFYLLRQRFSDKDWQTAGRLVSDIRIQLQRRRYPRRDVAASGLIQTLKAEGASTSYLAVIERLLKDAEGKPLAIARFQQEAIQQQFHQLRSGGDRALVIGAGTGAGKTKAFYVPAMAEIASLQTSTASVKILAIYPRTELLKDQLNEAFVEARKLDLYLAEQGKALISAGAYYGDTLQSAGDLLRASDRGPVNGWVLKDDGSGWICPYFICPNPSCKDREMVWSKEDVIREAQENERGEYGGHARLGCPSCHYEVSASQLVLTRAQMIHQPPDILFTTTEMLNRRLGRVAEHELFGIGVHRPPCLVLLDEIHTYEGLHGAQVAYLLRRWQYARGGRRADNKLCVVGLSATLRDAVGFFSKLTGIPEPYVTYIAPAEEDLVEEAMEYNLVLKGDPVSGTSLLSTSVQTIMLLGRMLDRLPQVGAGSASRGAIGQKIFAFSDKLDVINRWHAIEIDAEKQKNLSQYRKARNDIDSDTKSKLFNAGQIWTVCEQIGHNLRTPLRVGLTSSQYHGVQANADVIIATSTLEVGFNDVAVGAVIQHKAPRTFASFLQRKGRAGRTRTMRPWMVAVTSAYGRDRWAFQHAENLFNPLLPPLDLPIRNYYVQKIQAAYALLDWIAFELKKQGIPIDAWEICTNKGKGISERNRPFVPKVCTLLVKILDSTLLESFTRYLQASLSLQDDPDAIDLILWGEPRPLLLEVVPTLLRQLESNWQVIRNAQVSPMSEEKSSTPLPRFLPSSLFSDLNLPELALRIPDTKSSYTPPGNRGGRTNPPTQPGTKDESMELSQGLQEFAPGNVSKRFSPKERIKESHWLSLPDDAQLSRGMLPLQYLKVVFNPVPEIIEHPEGAVPVYRPVEYSLDVIPKEIRDTSQARLLWKSNFAVRDKLTGHPEAPNNDSEGQDVEFATHLFLTPGTHWHRFFKEILSYTQVNGSWIKVTRYAIGVDVDTRYENGNQIRRRLIFEENGQPAAIGFTIDADALRFVFEPLDAEALAALSEWPDLLKTLTGNYFLYRLRSDKRVIEEGLSSFDVEWLWQLELSMLTAVAIAKGVSLQEASNEVNQNRLPIADRTMRVIFQSQQQGETVEDDVEGRLFKRLHGYQMIQAIVDSICDCERVLWSQPDVEFFTWLAKCYASSLGAAVYTAITQTVSDIQPEDLAMDVQDNTIWISETTAGGVGLISKVADAISLHPRDFELQLEDCLEYCEREQLSSQLELIAEKITQGDLEIRKAFSEARRSGDLPKVEATRRLLTQTLKSYGIPVRRELLVALNTKFLRPNSDSDSDELIAMLVNEWKDQESRLGISIDLRVMAVAAWRIPKIQDQISLLIKRTGGGAYTLDESQIFNLLQSMLWLKCNDSCPDCIEYWNPYQELPHPSRALIKGLFDLDSSVIRFAEEGWAEKIQESLATTFQVSLACSQAQLEECKNCLLDTLLNPIEIGFQIFYPIIERIVRKNQEWEISIVVKELLGG